ncbi:peptidylprolyl isomerase [Kordiimonas pumila]|uniref:peptidylprolyl isomerase n=1 Tax=Kordiimonas pumila TaxID=2161677 RepID=A0ABV7D582_9PROT|nr:peptidylprolyl isomerase [Kordiimonas pumila]
MSSKNTILIVDTALGVFELELDHVNAPVTAKYFQKLATMGALDGTSVFRIVTPDNNSYNPDVAIHVVQGGRMESDAEIIPPIRHESTQETGLLHKKWSLSTARYDVGQTYGSFFIVMQDEPALDHGGTRHPDGQGFAVFGRVSSGYDVVEKIFSRAEQTEFLANRIQINTVRPYEVIAP